jgi:hypothetical protein
MSKFPLTPWLEPGAQLPLVEQNYSSVPTRALAPYDLANYLKGEAEDGQHSTSLANVTVIT